MFEVDDNLIELAAPSHFPDPLPACIMTVFELLAPRPSFAYLIAAANRFYYCPSPFSLLLDLIDES